MRAATGRFQARLRVIPARRPSPGTTTGIDSCSGVRSRPPGKSTAVLPNVQWFSSVTLCRELETPQAKMTLSSCVQMNRYGSPCDRTHEITAESSRM